MRRVVLSCTHSSTYDFFLPIAIRIWRERIGYEPVAFLLGGRSEWESGHRKVVLDRVDCRTEFVDRVPGIPDSNVAMAVRQHAAALSWVSGSDLMVIGDVDLIPIRWEFYYQHDPLKVPIAIYHADMYWDTYWPAYGPSMTAETWREVMKLSIGDLRGSLLKTFKDGSIEKLIAANKADHYDSRLWTFDERYASQMIRESRFYDKILRIRSNNTEDRLCRNRFPSQVDASRYIDFHCHRPGWAVENWEKIRGILNQIVPSEIPWIDNYVTEYRNSAPSVKDPFA